MKTVSAVQQQTGTASKQPTKLIARVLGVVSLVSIIVIHWLDLPSKLSEVPYLGYAYIALMVGSALSAILLLQDDKRGWALGGALALGSIIAYVLNRTVGLPYAMDDISNWLEPLGVYSLIAESVMVALSGWMFFRRDENALEPSHAGDLTKW
jgi:DMSO reductase anchor subunit